MPKNIKLWLPSILFGTIFYVNILYRSCVKMTCLFIKKTLILMQANIREINSILNKYDISNLNQDTNIFDKKKLFYFKVK